MMRKAVTTVAFILILASFINGFLGKDARGNTPPVARPEASGWQAAAGDQGEGALNAALNRKERAEALMAPLVFDLPSVSPVQAPPKTTVMTTKSVSDEPTAQNKPTATSSQPTSQTTQPAADISVAAARPSQTTTSKATTTTSKATTTTTTTTTPTTTTTTRTTTSTTPAPTTSKAPTTTSQAPTSSQALKGYYCYDFEAEVVRLINIERAKEGIGPVTMNQSLRSSAAVRALEIVDKFSHERPNGERWVTCIKVRYKCAGENIAAGQRTPERVVQAWMNSEGHRKNIMNPRYSEVGVACYFEPDSTYRYYWGQLFMGHN